MPRTCTICKHKERKAIDLALVNGAPLRDIARRFTVSKDALQRHKSDHIPDTLTLAVKEHDQAHADNLLDRLEELTDEAHRLKDKAEMWGDYKTAIGGVKELVHIIDLLAEMQGKLNRNAQVSVLIAPEWVSIRTAILAALEPFPEAKRAVIEALNNANPSK